MAASAPIRLLLVGTCGSAFTQAAHLARAMGAEVALADTIDTALDALRRAGSDLVVADVEMDVPGLIAKLRAERNAVPVLACGIDAPASRAVAAIRAGAYDYLPLPPERGFIAAALLSIGKRTATPISDDPALLRTIEFGRAVAGSNAPILLHGEGGTGKQVLARMIHEASGRSGRFILVECAGVGRDILDSELFGHPAGAFAEAVARRSGALSLARDGTVFLRQVEALDSRSQARLIAILQNGCMPANGDGDAESLTARIVASASHDLADCVAAGSFRADLQTRLSLIRLDVPPLRSRGHDIELLARHFAEQLAEGNGVTHRPFDDDALALLRNYDWPGNVRELEDLVHRAILLASGDSITPNALVLANGDALAARCSAEPRGESGVDAFVGRSVADVERELILQTLEHCGGNRTSASSILGISVRTMRNKLRSFIEAGIAVAPPSGPEAQMDAR